MATNNFTTRTAALRASKIDTSKIVLKGKNILDYITESKTKVLDERGDFVTDQDLWGTTVTTDENGVVHVSHKFLNNSSNLSNSIGAVKDNKAYTSTDASGEPLCNIQTEMIKDGSKMFEHTYRLTLFDSDLSSLVNGSYMFYNRDNLESFSGDLSSLVDGTYMFFNTKFTSFSEDLSSLVNGRSMFSSSSITSFNSDLSSLVNGDNMFSFSSITSFNSDLSSLVNGGSMFNRAPLTSFSGDLSNLVHGGSMFYQTHLTSFSSNLSSLVNGGSMFYETPLESFSSNLSSLVDGYFMFYQTHLTSFSRDLSSLVDGYFMFYATPLEQFSGDLSNLVHGYAMFNGSSLTSFSSNLSSLVDGYAMFEGCGALTSFSGDLSSLVNGESMFASSSITSFSGDLSSLVNGYQMFRDTLLESFNQDLSSLVQGFSMFTETYKRDYTRGYYKMVNGVKEQITVNGTTEGLTSFSCDLGSLQCGYKMFGDGQTEYITVNGVTKTIKNITPLDEQSVMIIADTIKDLNGFNDWDDSVDYEYRGIIHIGYDSEVCDAANIEEYCTEIMNKGWTVYLNGTVQTTDEGIEGIATTDEDGTVRVTPVPYYCKPLEVEQKEAEWTDGEKYYIILGAQKVFGDDLSTYGMFTSIENAAMNMGFTPYKYVEEKTETIEEN